MSSSPDVLVPATNPSSMSVKILFLKCNQISKDFKSKQMKPVSVGCNFGLNDRVVYRRNIDISLKAYFIAIFVVTIIFIQLHVKKSSCYVLEVSEIAHV